MVEKAKELCEDLLENVKEQYEDFKTRPPRQHYGGHGHGNHGGHGGYNNHGRSDNRNDSYGGGGGYNNYKDSSARGGGGGGGGNGGGNSASPAPPGGAATPSNATDAYAQQYAQYYGGQDPYAPYGGYAA